MSSLPEPFRVDEVKRIPNLQTELTMTTAKEIADKIASEHGLTKALGRGDRGSRVHGHYLSIHLRQRNLDPGLRQVQDQGHPGARSAQSDDRRDDQDRRRQEVDLGAC